ncbi:hypothetical protein FB451DRAFT_1360469 [Mycena latifolia]|nr:hypothetical protein FB451DRAFT_1360469 [Mycena latifolia]
MAPPAASTGLALLESGDTTGLLSLPPYTHFDTPADPPSTHPQFSMDADEFLPSPAFDREEERVAFYLFNHWAVNLLVPFLHRPSRVPRTRPSYMAWILDHCIVVFSAYGRFHSLLPKTKRLGVFLAALEALILQLPEEILDQPSPPHGTRRDTWTLCLGEAMQPFMVKDARLPFNFQLPLFTQPEPFFVAEFRYARDAAESFKDLRSPSPLEELLPFLASRQDFQTAVMEKRDELLLAFCEAHRELVKLSKAPSSFLHTRFFNRIYVVVGVLAQESITASSAGDFSEFLLPRDPTTPDFLPTGFRLLRADEDLSREEQIFPFPTLSSLNATPDHAGLLREIGDFVATRPPSAPPIPPVRPSRVLRPESSFYVELPFLKQVVASARTSVPPVQTSGAQDVESEDETIPPPKKRKRTAPVNALPSASNAAASSSSIDTRRPIRKELPKWTTPFAVAKRCVQPFSCLFSGPDRVKTTPTKSKTPPPSRERPKIVLFPDDARSESIPGGSESHNELEDEFEASSSGSAKRKNKGKGKARPKKKRRHVSEEAAASPYPLDHKIGRSEAAAKEPYHPSQAVPPPNVTGLLESLSAFESPGGCLKFDLALNVSIEAVLRDRVHLANLHSMVNEAQLRLMESSYWLGVLVKQHLEFYGPASVADIQGIPSEDKTSEMMAPYLDNREVVDGARSHFGIPGADNQQESKWVDFLLGYKEKRDAMLADAPLEPESEEVRQAILAGPSTSKGKEREVVNMDTS